MTDGHAAMATDATTRFDVVGVGENSVDLVYRLPGLPRPNGKLPIVSRGVRPGGQVATTLCTCSALGLKTAYVGAFGNDAEGGLIRDTLRARGVDTTHAVTRRAPNRHALVLVDDVSGDRAVLWQRDAALSVAPAEIPGDVVRRARVVHVDATDEPAALAAARLAGAAGANVTTDIDAVTPATRELLALATLPIVAAEVPAQMTGETDVERALQRLGDGLGGRVCVTLGERGALLLDGGRLHRAPAFRVAVVDTTGAGDVFRGALIYALLRGDDPATMLRFATAAAAISCTREGAIDGVPTLGEIEALVAGSEHP
jgi:sugar/nucleoside kinase (ribokinase family)